MARVFDLAAAAPGTAVFVHCGVLSVGARKKLGLPSPFEMRYGNPLDLQGVALAHPRVPIIVPHFGAGMFREALMLADACANVYFDTSSSNAWMRYTPGLTLAEVFRTALEGGGAGAAAVRHRLVVLPARLAGRGAGGASGGTRRRRGDPRAVAAGPRQQLRPAVSGAGGKGVAWLKRASYRGWYESCAIGARPCYQR